MMKLFLFLILFSLSIISQENHNQQGYILKESSSVSEVNFELGIRDELDLMLVKYHAGNSIEFGIIPINIHLTTGVRFLKSYKIDVRYGIMVIYEDFEGFDIGIFLLSDLFSSNFYGSLGIDYFNGIGSSHNSGSTGGSFTFFCLGLGYNVSKHFNLDLMYCFPNEKVFAYYQSDFFRNIKVSMK